MRRWRKRLLLLLRPFGAKLASRPRHATVMPLRFATKVLAGRWDVTQTIWVTCSISPQCLAPAPLGATK
jgi:hypothetical protein